MLHSCWYVSNSRCFSNNFNLKLGWSGFLLQVHGHLECAILISNNVQSFGNFLKKKQHFHYILRRPLREMDVLDNRLSCYIVVDMFLIQGVFLIISTWNLVDQVFYFKCMDTLNVLFLFPIMYKNTERLDMLIVLHVCLFLMSNDIDNMSLGDS